MVIHYRTRQIEHRCLDFDTAVRFFGNYAAAQKLMILMALLHETPHFSSFLKDEKFSRYKAHELKGEKKNSYGLRVNYSYRVRLKIEILAAADGEDEIKILEVSNHYGD